MVDSWAGRRYHIDAESRSPDHLDSKMILTGALFLEYLIRLREQVPICLRQKPLKPDVITLDSVHID